MLYPACMTAASLLALSVLSAHAQPPIQDGVSPARLLEELKALPTQRSPNASDEHRAGLRRVEDDLLTKLRALGYEPSTQDIDYLGSGRDETGAPKRSGPAWRNIIVELKGRTHAEEILIFSAHIDAVPRAPGADDDGSGTVALLEMARLLRDLPMQRTVRLIFFNLEEVGLVGSRAYVESIDDEIKGERIAEPGKEAAPTAGDAAAPAISRRPPAHRIVGMTSIDGVGYFTDEPDSQKSPIPRSRLFEPPTIGNFLGLGGLGRHRGFSRALVQAMKAGAPGLKVVAADFLPVAPPDLLRSDHAPFLAAGVPAVILADTANFRNPHYHQPTDEVATIDMERYTLVVRGLVAAAHTLAGPVGEELPDLSLQPKPTPPKP